MKKEYVMNKNTILTILLILMMNHSAVNSKECSGSENINYEVSMKYIGYDTLASADLPPARKFNLNESDPEDQKLKYKDENTDTIITIKRNSTIKSEITFSFFEQKEEVQLLDDTGFFTAHFLVQNLMKQANENGEINPDAYTAQIKQIEEQLEKFKEIVEEFSDVIENDIGDELWEGDGVLDVLKENPINVSKLAIYWKKLIRDTYDAADRDGIQVQAYVLEPAYSEGEKSSWRPIDIPYAWQTVSRQELTKIQNINIAQNGFDNGIADLTGAQHMRNMYERIDHSPAWNSDKEAFYYASANPEEKMLIEVLPASSRCIAFHSSITGQPRSRFGRIMHSLRGGKKNTNSSQGGSGSVR